MVKFSELIKNLPQDQPIFVGESKIYNSTVNNILSRHCKECGISEISIHGLRHIIQELENKDVDLVMRTLSGL